jgi:hypothetical protein
MCNGCIKIGVLLKVYLNMQKKNGYCSE